MTPQNLNLNKDNLGSPAKKFGELLTAELQQNPHFYFFSPDETTSNKFDQIFTVQQRAWNLPRESWDLPESPDGHIIEMLSENVLFSVLTGHLMNGEPAMLGSYEAFLPICTAQILQQLKFIKQSKKVSWRQPLPAVNLLSTSTCWRQDHNGFTHQSPALISTLLDLPSNLSNCFFPLDDVSVQPIYNFMLHSTNVVNLTTFNKIDEPRFLTPDQAQTALGSGITVFDLAGKGEPDLILAAAGDLVAREALAAIRILQQDIPELKIRFVYISSLSYQAIGTTEHKLSAPEFDQAFTSDKPIIANFHGYPATLHGILSSYAAPERLHVHGFIDEGSTTTPFEMLRLNQASRYDLAIDAAQLTNHTDLIAKYQQIMTKNHAHAVEHGTDIIE